MIWVGIKHDVIRVPQPIADKIVVIRRAAKSPMMLGSEAAIEAAMRPRMFQMVMTIIAARVVTHPLPVLIDMWSVGMIGLVSKVAVFFRRVWIATIRLGTA